MSVLEISGSASASTSTSAITMIPIAGSVSASTSTSAITTMEAPPNRAQPGGDSVSFSPAAREFAHADEVRTTRNELGSGLGSFVGNRTQGAPGGPKEDQDSVNQMTKLGTGDVAAQKNADGTWSVDYQGEKYTAKADGKFYNSKGEEVAHADDKGDIYTNDGKKAASYKANGNYGVIDVDGDKNDNVTVYTNKDGSQGGTSTTYKQGQGPGAAWATDQKDGSWDISYQGQHYTAKDGKIIDKDGNQVATYDKDGNIHDGNGKRVAKGKAGGPIGDATIDVF
ncbi:MAG: hypothetical protein HY319_19760 [Armatimonadetes bacterium]|nr:hypothetical protein [Armatimonadota bacterium]